jgi:hypothetical protein
MLLECSSKGDKRFSAFYAQVEVFDVVDSIENHYQLSKRFGNDIKPRHWKECKGRKPSHFMIGRHRYDLSLFSLWYKSLWLKYFEQNPDLLVYIGQFDEFNDMFKGKSLNCQADVIRDIANKGYLAVCKECKPLFDEIIKNIKRA